MTELFLNAFFAVRGFHGNLLERARTERGASMVEYALLVGLIAVVAVVAIAALGGWHHGPVQQREQLCRQRRKLLSGAAAGAAAAETFREYSPFPKGIQVGWAGIAGPAHCLSWVRGARRIRR